MVIRGPGAQQVNIRRHVLSGRMRSAARSLRLVDPLIPEPKYQITRERNFQQLLGEMLDDKRLQKPEQATHVGLGYFAPVCMHSGVS